MRNKINLQLLSEGGASAGAATSVANTAEGGAATGVHGDSPVSQGDDLSNVVYGKSTNQDVANPTDIDSPEDINPADLQKAFDDMVKKGGKYADAFNKRTQDIINKRFKETKGLEETLKSHDVIMQLLSAKYGVDAKDSKALEDAINKDTSMFEEAAFKEGLTVEQYRDKIQLEQENARLKAAQEEAAAQANADQIYAGWLKEADALVQKYGLTNFDMAAEMENPEFTQLLGAGASFEAAYKTVHFDDMLGGAMAQTAQNVSQAMVNKIQSRSRRPAENGIESASGKIFKSDPSKFTVKDLDEIKRRVAAGEEIAF